MRNTPCTSDEVAISQRTQQIFYFAGAKVGIQQVQGAILPKLASGFDNHSDTASSVVKSVRPRLRTRAARKSFSEVSLDNGAPLPRLRVTVRRAMPNFAANALVERPNVEATCSNIAAGNPSRTWVRISRGGFSASTNADSIGSPWAKWLIIVSHNTSLTGGAQLRI